MDSMRNLHTSLPTDDSPRRQRRPKAAPSKGALLEAFRAAALSVTNLYKTSERERDAIYESGYQDALSDLVAFLDKENLGLGDGEGWRVRQWATERYTGNRSGEGSGADSEEDEEQRARSSSPTADRKEEGAQEESGGAASSPLVEVIPEPESVLLQRRTSFAAPSRVDFTFQTAHPYPTMADIDMNSSDTVSPHQTPSTQRRSQRNTRNHTRSSSRPSTTISLGSLGGGAGVKRKTTFPDFFGIQGFPGDSKDGFAGGKRGRFA